MKRQPIKECAPVFVGAPIILNLAQVRQLLELFGECDAEIAVVDCEDGHSGPGVYAWFSDYPDEGSEFLDPDEEPSS